MAGLELIKSAQADGRTHLTEVEAKKVVAEAGIPVVRTVPARSQREAMEAARDIGFPVALKVVSADIIHKSDAGGVRLDLKNAAQVAVAYREIMASVKKLRPEARIEGVAVQKMAPPGIEVVIGMTKDAQFGPVLMFGLGGILVELLKDVSFRIVPLTERDAAEMIREIRGFPLLEGYRGREGADIGLLEQLIMKVARLAEEKPEIKELDLNPVIASKNGAVVADARIVLEG